MLLPYLEQGAMANACNYSSAPDWGTNTQGYAINATAMTSYIGAFICPSDGMSRVEGWYLNNYVGSNGNTVAYAQPASTGLFASADNCGTHNIQVYGLRDVTDGSSNTIAFGEALLGGDTWGTPVWRHSINAGGGGGSGPSFSYQLDAWGSQAIVLGYLQTCTTLAQAQAKLGTPPTNNSRGYAWCWGYMGDTMFNTIVPPNSAQYMWGTCGSSTSQNQGFDQNITNASSNHPGGANFLFADGSVHYLKSSISMNTYWSLGTRGDGEVISADSY